VNKDQRNEQSKETQAQFDGSSDAQDLAANGEPNSLRQGARFLGRAWRFHCCRGRRQASVYPRCC